MLAFGYVGRHTIEGRQWPQRPEMHRWKLLEKVADTYSSTTKYRGGRQSEDQIRSRPVVEDKTSRPIRCDIYKTHKSYSQCSFMQIHHPTGKRFIQAQNIANNIQWISTTTRSKPRSLRNTQTSCASGTLAFPRCCSNLLLYLPSGHLDSHSFPPSCYIWVFVA